MKKNNSLGNILTKKTTLKHYLLTTRITIILLFSCLFCIMAENGYTQNTKVTINKQHVLLKEVLSEIEKQTNYLFIYDNKVNTHKVVSIEAKAMPVSEILSILLNDTEINYSMEEKHIILTYKELTTERISPEDKVLQQKKRITGIVRDQNGEPIIGANILEKGTSNGAITDINGGYSIQVDENAIIRVSYIGYITREINTMGRTSMDIALEEDTNLLGEVVITALGINREEKALGYAVQKVEGESLTTVKGVNVATSLTGKIAGLNIRNSTEFETGPSILLRGKSPLIIIDGVPFGNTSLSDIASDDIESITVQKGPAASSLYGSRGGNGAIMITTKRGKKEGLHISVNSNTMFNAGHIRIPKPQTSYSTGNNGLYDRNDFVWGDKMDIGRTAVQYDPYTYEWKEMPLVSKGKDNFKNFLETALVTNNNIAVTYKAKNGSIRSSLNHIYNKGQYPNLQSNRFNYSVSGEFEIDKLKFDGGISMSHFNTPQTRGAGYGATGYVYNFLVWTGTDFDIRDFRNYWQLGKEQEVQNWWNPGWYDNPYFLAYERTSSSQRNKTSSHFSATYSPNKWLKTIARVGHDYYSNSSETRTPLDTRGSSKGGFSLSSNKGYSINTDLMALSEHRIGDLTINGLLGGSIYYYDDNGLSASTNNGLSIPGFYSLKASVDPVSASSSVKERQLNSVYGQVSLGWRSTLYLDINGRNDWVSTLEKSERSYFYPALNTSFIASEVLPVPEWLTYWKMRGSWSMTKTPPGVYDINMVYTISKNLWDNKNGARYPSSMRDKVIKPETKTSWEIGTELYLFNNRLRFDMSYYQELLYNLQRNATISSASGFSNVLVNYGEEQQRKGIELTLEGDIIDTKDFKWVSTLNWAADRYYYHKVDENYSTDRPWVAPGKRWDWRNGTYDWERDSEGNIVHLNGKPQLMQYESSGFYEHPSWIWGFNNQFKLKSFTVNISFDGRVGGYGYDQTEQAMWNSGTHPDSDNEWRYDQVVNGKTNYIGKGVKVVSGQVKYDKYGQIEEDTRVFAPNDVEIGYQEYIQAYHSWSGNARTQNIKKMTFFKLRELAIGYTLPQTISKKIHLNNVNLSLVGQNLLIWSPNFKHSDPDVHSNALNSPSIRYIGLNVKFDF